MSIHSITFLTSLMWPHCNGSVFPANYHPQTHPSQTSTIICSMLMSIQSITFLTSLMWPHCNGSVFPANYHPQTHHSQTSTIICPTLMSIHAITFLNALMWPPHLRPAGLINNSHDLKIDMKFFIIHWCRCKTLYIYMPYILQWCHIIV